MVTDLDVAENFDKRQNLLAKTSKKAEKLKKPNSSLLLSRKFKRRNASIFLCEEMDSVKHFEIPKNDANRAHKEIAVEFLNLVGLGRPKEALRFFAPECKTHNPYTVGGMDELTDAMIAVQKEGAEGILKGSKAEFELIIRQVLADNDLVAVHTQISSSIPSEGGLRQVNLFRFRGDKIVEYWDISQLVPENAPNAAGAFS